MEIEACVNSNWPNWVLKIRKTDLTWFRLKVEMLLSSYRRILMVSKAQVLSANKPDLRDIMTLQASGVP